MNDNEKKPLDEGQDIASLLADFSRQKQEHTDNFGTLEPPVKGKEKPAEEKTFSENNAPKIKAEKKKKRKRIIIIAIAVIGAVAAIAGIICGVSYSKTAYLKPYQQQYPDVKFPEGIRKEYCEQYALQTSTRGYLKIPACNYDSYVFNSSKTYPVLDKNCSARDLDFNTTVYITNPAIDLESAFSTADAYLNSEQSIEFSTLYKDYKFNVIGAFYTNSLPQDDAGYVFPYNLNLCPVGSDFDNYTDRLYHRFLYNTDYAITRDDKLLTIASKSDFMPNFRFVVVAVMDGEAQAAATPNNKVHYPQVWYDENNQQNPYRFADQWYPTVLDKNEKPSQQAAENFTQF